MSSCSTKRVDPETRFQTVVEKLQERGYRLTPQRLALLRLLAASDDHPTAHELQCRISEHFPTTSPATIYKTLAVLTEMGEVLELGFGDYDTRYDGNRPDPHPHLVCIRCHAVMDADSEALDEVSEKLTELYGGMNGYQVLSHRIDLVGICPRCQRSG